MRWRLYFWLAVFWGLSSAVAKAADWPLERQIGLLPRNTETLISAHVTVQFDRSHASQLAAILGGWDVTALGELFWHFPASLKVALGSRAVTRVVTGAWDFKEPYHPDRPEPGLGQGSCRYLSIIQLQTQLDAQAELPGKVRLYGSHACCQLDDRCFVANLTENILLSSDTEQALEDALQRFDRHQECDGVPTQLERPLATLHSASQIWACSAYNDTFPGAFSEKGHHATAFAVEIDHEGTYHGLFLEVPPELVKELAGKTSATGLHFERAPDTGLRISFKPSDSILALALYNWLGFYIYV